VGSKFTKAEFRSCVTAEKSWNLIEVLISPARDMEAQDLLVIEIPLSGFKTAGSEILF